MASRLYWSDEHFDDDNPAQYTVCEGFGPAELPKTANDDDYTDLEKQKQNIKEAEKQIETGY